MAWRGRLFGVCAALGAAGVLSGCLSQTGSPAALPVSRDTPFVLNEPETVQHTTTARLQQSEMPDPPATARASPQAARGDAAPVPCLVHRDRPSNFDDWITNRQLDTRSTPAWANPHACHG